MKRERQFIKKMRRKVLLAAVIAVLMVLQVLLPVGGVQRVEASGGSGTGDFRVSNFSSGFQNNNFLWRGYAFEVSREVTVTHLWGGGGGQSSAVDFQGGIYKASWENGEPKLGELLGFVEFNVMRDTGDPPQEELVRLKNPDNDSNIDVTLQTEQLYFIAQGTVSDGSGIHYAANSIDFESIAIGSPIIEEWWPQSNHAFQPGGSGTAESRVGSIADRTTDVRVLMGFRYETNVELPQVETVSAVSTGQNTAVLTGNLINDGGDSSTNVYFEYSTTSNLSDAEPLITDKPNGTGEFTLEISELSAEIEYYYRAVAINEAGRAEGDIKSFVHASTPTVETNDAEDITANSAELHGNVTDDGGEFAVTERGFVDSGNDNIGKAENGTGEFSFTWADLDPNTEYSFQAYARNEAGTAYGSTLNFRTLAAVPGLSDASVQDNGDVELTLERNDNPGGTEFKVQGATDSDFSENTATALEWHNPGTGTSLIIDRSDLEPGVENYFRVKARNADEEVTSYGDDTISALAQSDPPPAPNVTADSDTQLTVSWDAMTGADSYAVYENGTEVVLTTEETSITRADLNPDTSYEYEIVSKNESGDSPKSASTTKYTHATVPDLTTAEPQQNGDVVITVDKKENPDYTEYYIEKSTTSDTEGFEATNIDGETLGAEDDTFTITGLERDTNYHFRIRAQNGDDVFTEYGDTVSALTVPPVPTIATVLPADTGGNHAITIRWDDVRADSDDLKYYIYENGAQIAALTEITDNTTYTHTGREPNTVYTYKITAKNANGVETVKSASKQAATLATTPEIDSLEGRADGKVFIYVDEKDNPENTEYYIEKSTDSSFATTTQSRDWSQLEDGRKLTIEGLDPGKTYYYRIKARNNNQEHGLGTEKIEETGWGSTQATVITVPEPLSQAPTVTVNTPDNVTISWDAVTGAADYRIYRKIGAGDYEYLKAVTGTSTSDVGLEPNTPLQYKVKPRNSSGVSADPHPESTLVYTHTVRPDLTLEAQPGGTDVLITIDPQDNRPGTQYEVEASEAGGEDFDPISDKTTDWSTSLEQTITGLDPGTQYYFRARARNGNDGTGSTHESDPSDIQSTSTVLAPPAAPRLSEIDVDSIKIEWDTVDGANTYKLYRNGKEITELAATTYTDTGLAANSQYSYTVAAVNDGGTSSQSEASEDVYTKAALPTAMTVTGKTQDSITFSIQPSSANDVGPQYRIVLKDKETEDTVNTAWSTNTSNVEVSGLNNTVEYEVWLQARNEPTNGPSSRLVTDRETPFIDSIYANSPPEGGFQAENNGSGMALHRSFQEGFNGDFEITGKAWDPNNGEKLTVTAVINGITRTVVLNTSPTAEPAEDNFTLSWDVYALQAGTPYTNIEITIADEYGESTTITFAGTMLLDTTPPVIKFNGDPASNDTLHLFVGGTYDAPTVTAEDPGADADPATGSGINTNLGENGVVIGGDNVDTNTAGTYTVTYTATDKVGNSTTITRTIHVAETGTRNKEAYEAIINGDDEETTITNMDDVRELFTEIQDNSFLSEEEKQDLYAQLADMVLDEESEIDIESAQDIQTLKDLINSSDKDTSDKNDALADLAEKALEDLTKEDRLLTQQEQEAIGNIINGLPGGASKNELSKKHEYETIKSEIEALGNITDARQVFNKIDGSENLTEADKKDLLSRFTDKVLDEESGISIETADDVEKIKTAIAGSDRTDEEKQLSYEKAAEKAIGDLTKHGRELSQEERDTIGDVINQITDKGTKDTLNKSIPDAKDKAALETEIGNIETIQGARLAAQNIENSSLSDEEKQELRGKLADKMLGIGEYDNESGIEIETANDVGTLKDLINNSDKTDAEKQAAYKDLVEKALEELKDGDGKLTRVEQDAIWDIINNLNPKDDQLEEKLIEAATNSATTMDDIRAVKDKINSSNLSDAEKEARKNNLVDHALNAANYIQLATADDVNTMKDLIDNSNKGEQDPPADQQAYQELATKAIADLSQQGARTLSSTESSAVQDVINNIDAGSEKDALQTNLNQNSPQLNSKEDFETAIGDLGNMTDAHQLAQDIDNSELTDSEKEALRGKLADIILGIGEYDTEDGLAVATTADKTLIQGLIENSNKDAGDKTAAQEELNKRPVQISGFTLMDGETPVVGDVAINHTDRTITVTNVPYSTTITSLTADITIFETSTIMPTGSQVRNFTNPQAYIVRAADNTEKTYTVTVTKAPPSDNADLASVEMEHQQTNVAFSPTFTKDGLFYTASVANNIDSIQFTPTLDNSFAAITVRAGGDEVAKTQGENYYEINLGVGTTVVEATVTAENGATQTYQWTFTRASAGPASTNADLASLTLGHGSLSPAFHKEETDYNVTLAHSVASQTVEAQAEDSTAGLTIRANGVTISSGDTFNLNVGSNVLTVTVTAAAGQTRTYSVSITREPAPAPSPAPAPGGGGGGGGGGGPAPAADNDEDTDEDEGGEAEVFESGQTTVRINDEEVSAGNETTGTGEDGRLETRIEVDFQIARKTMEEVLEQQRQNGAPANGVNQLEIPVNNPGADIIKSRLENDLVQSMKEENFNLRINAQEVVYEIPAAELSKEKAEQQAGVPLDNFQVEVTLERVPQAEIDAIVETARQQGLEVIVPPMRFSITGTGTDPEGNPVTVDMNRHSSFSRRVMEIPEGTDPEKITTGVVFHADGSYSHVPTEVYEENGKWYARINSLTNSTYSVIWNPVEVASVEDHWAKDHVNDMASRLVIVDPTAFQPDSPITRADFADYISRALGIYHTGDAENRRFIDIGPVHQQNQAVDAAVAYGIISGYPDGSFGPDRTITREEAMTMYAKAIDIVRLPVDETDYLSGYQDRQEVSSWAAPFVNKSVGAGVFQGRTAETINPGGTFTYAEAATAVRLLLQQAILIDADRQAIIQ